MEVRNFYNILKEFKNSNIERLALGTSKEYCYYISDFDFYRKNDRLKVVVSTIYSDENDDNSYYALSFETILKKLEYYIHNYEYDLQMSFDIEDSYEIVLKDFEFLNNLFKKKTLIIPLKDI